MTTRLIAKEKFFYAGRNVEKDEEFDAEDIDVMLLTHHHTPKATTLEITPFKKKPASPDQPSEKDTKYRTRHLTAGSLDSPPSEPSSAPGRATPGSAAAKWPKT
jgi:hypothetical protein